MPLSRGIGCGSNTQRPAAHRRRLRGETRSVVAPMCANRPEGLSHRDGYDWLETNMGFGKDGKGVIIRETRAHSVGALAQVVTLLDTKLATLERFRMLKNETVATIVGVTAGEGVGLYLGLADGDFTAAEIEAAIESNGPLGPNAAPEEELAERFMMWLGAADFVEDAATEALFLNEKGGYLMTSIPRWTFSRTKSWNFFLYNIGVALTTGATLNLRSKSFGVWVT